MFAVYDTSINTNVVVLNTIHIDIMDYIIPASCTDTEFRQMWQDFEWENKVRIFLFYILPSSIIDVFYVISLGNGKHHIHRFA